jgi:hypothetical protein
MLFLWSALAATPDDNGGGTASSPPFRVLRTEVQSTTGHLDKASVERALANRSDALQACYAAAAGATGLEAALSTKARFPRSGVAKTVSVEADTSAEEALRACVEPALADLDAGAKGTAAFVVAFERAPADDSQPPLGMLPKDAIDRVVKRGVRGIRRCYEARLAEVPTLAGTVKVAFVIDADGSVATASTEMSTMNDPTLERCLNERFAEMTFPAPSPSGKVIVHYPFVFTPG